MDKPVQQVIEKPKDTLETEIRKPKKGRKPKVSFNLKIEEKDVEIFFN